MGTIEAFETLATPPTFFAALTKPVAPTGVGFPTFQPLSEILD
ncbi:hypothetical protein [Acinetobacter bereziniae]|nr:hypothetical protein [Acinetobacter bereziniae]